MAGTAVARAHVLDLEAFQKALALKDVSKDAVTLPCHVLPVTRNRRFFGREELLKRIDAKVAYGTGEDGIRSVAVHGLGGVGKTQTALAYAYMKTKDLDGVFWISAETEVVLKQSFTRVALKLQLPNAHPQNHEENTVLVLNWINQTKAKWLLIFDNVEDVHILEDCWPVAERGSVLVTARHHSVAVQPIDDGIEIETFSTEEGADFLHHLLPESGNSALERQARLDLSTRLSGHALAISQMVALIKAKKMSVSSFVPYYDKYTKKIHRDRKAGWKYLGYDHTLDTVWLLSFGALSTSARLCLSVFAFIDPDRIPRQLFEPSEDASLPGTVECLRDEYE